MYKKGDRVKVVCGISYPQNGQYYTSQNNCIDKEYILNDDFLDAKNGAYWTFIDDGNLRGRWAFEFQLKLVSSAEQNKAEKKTMNIKEQFLLAITAEPQKSFRKAGITNGDDLLTEDGQKVFLSWL